MARYRLARPTVIRIVESDVPDVPRYWLMNRPHAGWNSFGYGYPTLEALVAAWGITVGDEGRDTYGRYFPCWNTEEGETE